MMIIFAYEIFYLLYREGNGDDGYDFFGKYKDYYLYIQAKDHNNAIPPIAIRSFISAVEQNPEPTFRIFIISERSRYASGALVEAQRSSRDLLLTTIQNMRVDIPAYVFRRKTFLQSTIARINRDLQEDTTKIRESIEVAKTTLTEVEQKLAAVQTTLTQVNRKLAGQEKKDRETRKKEKTDFEKIRNLVILGFICTNITILIISIFFILNK
jgi:hypothetical protein